jgi:tRNA pseudouridine55 synthase
MNGILLVKKEKNYTSRDVVNIVSKVLKTKKVGHTGTLDPIAQGVLVITVGTSTKLSELLTSSYKEYIASVTLGISTDTLDTEGVILKEEDTFISEEKIKEVLKNKIGKYIQEVPIYSAVKVDGKKLYEYARNKEEVVLPKKEVDIKNIELLEYLQVNNHTTFKFKTTVSKGTYIRSLIRDIAISLNTVGVMTDLIRTKQGKFSINDCYTIDQIKNNDFKLLNPITYLDIYSVEVDDYLANKIKNGQILQNRYNKEVIMFKYHNDLLAIYKVYDKDITKIKPWKMF